MIPKRFTLTVREVVKTEIKPMGAPPFSEYPQLYPPEDMEELRQHVRRTIEKAEPFELELRIICSDGEIRYCVMRGFPETNAKGKVVRLYGVLQDATEQYMAQQELTKLASEQRAIFDNVPAYIYFKDKVPTACIF